MSCPLKWRRHSFDDLVTLDRLDAAVCLRKCKSLCDKRWECKLKGDAGDLNSSDDDLSDWESVQSSISAATFPEEESIAVIGVPGDRKKFNSVPVPNPQLFEKPFTAPGDLTQFRNYHHWTPSCYDDTLAIRHSYERPTPTYVWKIRRRKFEKKKNMLAKRFEVLDLESDIDTEDDEWEEATELAMDIKHRQGQSASKDEWLKRQLAPLQKRRCSSEEEYSDSDNDDKGLRRKDVVSSSEEELCREERDSDYEYSHLWAESADSEDSELDVCNEGEEDMETEFLEKVPEKKRELGSNAFVRKIQMYDAPSPEPFLPDLLDSDSFTPECVHQVENPIAYGLLEVDKHPGEMAHVHKAAPNFKVEKPVSFEFDLKRKADEKIIDNYCSSEKVARFEIIRDPLSPPSPSSSSSSSCIPLFIESPPKPKIKDEKVQAKVIFAPKKDQFDLDKELLINSSVLPPIKQNNIVFAPKRQWDEFDLDKELLINSSVLPPIKENNIVFAPKRQWDKFDLDRNSEVSSPFLSPNSEMEISP